MKHTFIKFGALVFLLGSLQACIIVDEDGRGHREVNQGTTIGEELEDLADAYEDGLLSDQEYDRLRQRILNR